MVKKVNDYNNIESIKVNSNLLEINDILQYSLQNCSKFEVLQQINRFELRERVYRFFADSNFILHKMPFISTDNFKRICQQYDKNKKILEKTNQHTVLLHSLNVPILFCDRDQFYGECCPLYIKSGIDLFMLFTEFKLSTKLTIFSPGIYIHEIVHSQLGSTNYSIENYLNYEVLPIFFDMLFTLQEGENLKKLNEMYRLKILSSALQKIQSCSLTDFAKTKVSMIISSILKAFMLFNLYIDTDDKQKMLFDMQDIFDGKYSVEEMLSRNNIDNNNCQSCILIRQYLKEVKNV